MEEIEAGKLKFFDGFFKNICFSFIIDKILLQNSFTFIFHLKRSSSIFHIQIQLCLQSPSPDFVFCFKMISHKRTRFMKIHSKFAFFIRFVLLLDFVFARLNGIKSTKLFLLLLLCLCIFGSYLHGRECNRRKLFMNELLKFERGNES